MRKPRSGVVPSVLSLLAASSVYATSPPAPGHEPVGVKVVGDPEKPQLRCEVRAEHVQVTRYSDDGTPKVTTKKGGPGTKYAALIAEASKAELTRAMHIVETIPNVYYAAQVDTGSDLKDILLLKDGSQREAREGKAAEQLIQMLDKYCPTAKKAQRR